ncbi:MAG TPA: SpoVG family protein [Tepidisphaeraceae bacterium]|jgi:stage V sporulation protein G
MRLTDIRIKLCESQNQNNRLKAFCALTFDNTFVIRDVKLIEGNDGLFLAMPSRKLADHCPRCGEKNHLRARYCNNCGTHLDENRYQRYQNGNSASGGGHSRLKLHADIAHPINADCRQAIERDVVTAFHEEVEKSKQPGYVPPSLDGEDLDFYDLPGNGGGSRMRLRPTGTTAAR